MTSRWLVSSSFAVLAAALASGADAQTQSFDAAGQPLVFAGSGTGTGTAVGSSREYANVITINGTRIDARVTLQSLNNATLTTFDSTANPYAEANFLQPNLNISAVGGSATLRIDFLANGVPITLENFYANTYDLDGSGSSAAGRQYTDFTGFASHTLSTGTKVTRQNLGGGSRFVTTVGGNLNYAVGSNDFNTIRARVFYLSASSLTVSVGDTGAMGVAYYALDFSLGYAFNNVAADTTPPTVNAGQTFSYAENQAAGAPVGTVAATDTVGVTAFRFSSTGTQTSSDGFFVINNGGVIRLTTAGAAAGAASNDFETAPNTFVQGVQAGDSSGNWSPNTDITLNVTDLSDAPPVITGPSGGPGATASAVSVNEAQTSVATLTADRVVTWAITGGLDAGLFAVDATSGAITFVAAPDFEAPTDSDSDNVYQLVVTATDGASATSSQTMTVAVLDIAESAPAFTGTNSTTDGRPSYSFSHPENSAAGAVLGSVSAAGGTAPLTFAIIGGDPGGWYAIDAATGSISLTAAGAASLANDFEAAPNIRVLTLRVTDSAGAAAVAEAALNETDLDETPAVITGPSGGAGATASALSVNEEQTAVTTLAADEAVTWSIVGGADAARFAVHPSTGVVAFAAPPDFESPTDADAGNTYVVTVQAADAAGNISAQTLTVTVLDVDEGGPVITGPSGGPGSAVSAVSVNENQTAAAALTADEPATWSVVGGADAARFTVDPSTGALAFTAAPDYEAPTDADGGNTYLVTVQAADASGNLSSQTVTVSVLGLDETKPVITGPSGGPGSPSAAVSVDEGATAATTLTADETVSWSISGGPDAAKFRVEAGSGAVTFIAPPDFEAPADADGDNVYRLVVTAADAAGNTDAQALAVTVRDVDDSRPVLTGPSGGPGAADSSVSVNEGATAVTSFSAGESVTWAITGGPDAGRFAIHAGSGALNFLSAPDHEAPTDTDADNRYQLTVQAMDGAGLTGAQNVTVTVLDVDDAGPVITGPSGGPGAMSSAMSLNEGTTAVATLGANEAVTWNLAGGADAARFSISPTTGAVAFSVAPDYEAPADADADNTYLLIVTAMDAAGNASAQTITVTVLNLDDAMPVIAGSLASVSVNEGRTAVATAVADETVTWSVAGGADAVKFLVDATTGTIAFVSAPDFESPADVDGDNRYELVIAATDASGNVSARSITVTVLDLDDSAPALTGPSDGAISVDEGRTAVTTLAADEAVTWSISGGPDAARFAIDPSNGVVRFASVPDFETPADSDADNRYVLTVTATDGSGNAASRTLTVTVRDLDDGAPIIAGPNGGAGAASSSVSVAEGVAAVTSFTAGETVVWSISGGSDAARFAISPSTGALTFNAAPDFETPTDADGDNRYMLVVTATDASGNAGAQTVTVTVLDIDDRAPVVTGPEGGESAAFFVVEGAAVVAALAADETAAWSISGGPDAALFAIDRTTGALTFKAAPDFETPTDADGDNVYRLIVTAADEAGNAAATAVAVTVTDRDEAPPAIDGTGPAVTVSVPEEQTAVTTLNATEAVAWSITGGPDAARFAVGSDTGVIGFLSAPDYERPGDADGDNSYLLTIAATDASGNATSRSVVVDVTDVDDSPALIIGPDGEAGEDGAVETPVQVGEGLTAAATMAASEQVTWSITGGPDAARFTIQPTTGVVSFVTAPDFENPSDSDKNNDYVLEVSAVDASGNRSKRRMTLRVVDVDDSAPVIAGPAGGGDVGSYSVAEGRTEVATLTADEISAWAIEGGPDGAGFVVDAATGVLSFRTAPDFEAPADADRDNSYVLILTATDARGNMARRTVTIAVTDRDDGGPAITGPSGAAGAADAEIQVEEGLTAVAVFTADEPAAWSIAGGADAARFAMHAATGVLSFIAAPDFEAPADADRDNVYVVRVRATDVAGNTSVQTLTVRIGDADEIAGRLSEIAGQLRGGLRGYALQGLGDMLSFNEALMQARGGDCDGPSAAKTWSGGLNADEKSHDARLNWAKAAGGCERPYSIAFDAGVASSRMNGDWTTRALGSVRVEGRVSPEVTLGLALLGARADEQLPGFDAGSISDQSLQLNGYLRARLSGDLRAGAFGGFGRASYDFDLRDDGLKLTGDMTGKRHVYGAMLSGDLPIDGVLLTTDVIFSRAVERLGDAKLSASHLSENRNGVPLPVGRVDLSRLSVPVTARFAFFDTEKLDGRAARMMLSPGLLCEDSSAETASWTCGYQFGGRVELLRGRSGRAHFDYRHEAVDSTRRNLVGLGYAFRFGEPLELSFDVNSGLSANQRVDHRAMVRLKLAP